MVDKENVSINKTIKQTLINSLIKRKNTKKQKDGLKRRNKMKWKGEEIKERIKAKNNNKKKEDISKWDKPVSTKPHLQEQSRKVLQGIKQ